MDIGKGLEHLAAMFALIVLGSVVATLCLVALALCLIALGARLLQPQAATGAAGSGGGGRPRGGGDGGGGGGGAGPRGRTRCPGPARRGWQGLMWDG